jgi:hypothetical protein
LNDSAALLSASAAPEGSAERGRPGSVWALVGEFLLVGGGTLLLLPLCWWCGRALGLDRAEWLMGMLAFHAASLLNDPHFAVTYLLFYEDGRRRAFGSVYERRQRLRYWFAGVVVPLVLVVWAALAIVLGSAPVLGFMIQLMFVLVGWHYVKQGFGVLAVLSARRGLRWSTLERRVLLGHCIAGWAYAWLSPFDPGTRSVVNGVFYTTFPHPPGLELCARVVFFVSGLGVLGVLAAQRRRTQRWPPLGALAGLLCSIWAWTVYTRLDPLFAFWIPALHSVQYLYFVALLRRNAALEAAGPPSFKGNVGRQLGVLGVSALVLGWLSLRGLPSALDAALVLPARAGEKLAAIGPTPYLAAFTAVVNIHHYFMDSVIWRREHPETRHLLGETRSPRRVSPHVEEGPSAECPIGPGSTRPSQRSGARRTRHELGARGTIPGGPH